MKQTLIILAAILSLAACKSSDKKAETGGALTKEEIEKAGKDSANYTTLEWIDSTTRNLGQLVPNQEIEVTFRFRNSGNKVLVFQNVSASCGCTIPEQLTKPYAPGEEGVVKAKFNGSGHGAITKQITVVANTNPSAIHNLSFMGQVGEADAPAPTPVAGDTTKH